MRLKSSLLVLGLALVAGVGGMVAGGLATGTPPPDWLARLLGPGLTARWNAAITPPAPAAVPAARRGDLRPDLSFIDLTGEPHRLHEYDGKIVLVNFWATWCTPCREEMPQLEQAQRDFGPRGFQVVGVAQDDADAIRAYLEKSPVAYPVLLPDTPGADIALRFGNTRGALPYSVLIDRDGRIVDQRFGGMSAASIKQWLEAHL